MERFDLDRVPGVRFVPRIATATGVLVLAGSSGRADESRAHLLALQGAVAESIQWFGGPGQHEGPWEIAIETFLERVDDLARDCDRIVIVGTSFGAEAALLTGSISNRVSAVAAFAPSDVVWTGVSADGRMTSRWTKQGCPLPHVPFIEYWEPASDPPAFVDLYRASRRRFAGTVVNAQIPVERIPEVLVVAGGNDQVWPSTEHAQAIVDRRAAHGLPTTVITDPDAGHRTVLPGEPTFSGGMRIARGGTETTDRRLGTAAWPHLARLLRAP